MKSDREDKYHDAFMWNLKKKKVTDKLIYNIDRVADVERKLAVAGQRIKREEG